MKHLWVNQPPHGGFFVYNLFTIMYCIVLFIGYIFAKHCK